MQTKEFLVFILYTYTTGNEDNSNSYQLYKSTLSHTYPFLILDVDVSSLLNKEFHSEVTVFSSRNVQGSPLIGILGK